MSAAMEHYKAGLSLFGKGEHVAAIAEYEQALAEKPDWEDALHGLAMAQAQAGRLDDAIATGHRVAELNPDDPFAYTSLSMFYQRKSAAEGLPAEERDAFIAEAEKQQNKARMASWKQELKQNPDAPPPDGGGMHVVQ